MFSLFMFLPATKPCYSESVKSYDEETGHLDTPRMEETELNVYRITLGFHLHAYKEANSWGITYVFIGHFQVPQWCQTKRWISLPRCTKQEGPITFFC